MSRSPLLFVFDLDGTLIDSREVMRDAFEGAFRAVCGAGDPPLEEFLTMMGAPFPIILRELGLPQAIDPIFREIAASRINKIRLYEGALELCRDLRSRGMKVAIHTGKDRGRTLQILRFFGLSETFDTVMAGDDPFPGKPAPDGLLELCRMFGIAPAYTAMIGDSALDMRAGHAAATTTFACLWGMGEREELISAGADHVVGTEPELSSLLRGWIADRELIT